MFILIRLMATKAGNEKQFFSGGIVPAPLYFKNLKQNIYHARRFNIIQRLLLTYYSCYCCWCFIRCGYGSINSLLIN